MTLPITIPFDDDDSRLGYASRLAIANGYRSLKNFLRSCGVDPYRLAEGEDRSVSVLSHWSGVPVEQLSQLAMPRASPGSPWKIGEASFSNESRRGYRIRLCTHCVLGDIENGSGLPMSRPRLRALWLTRAARNCPVHKRALTEYDVPQADLNDFSRFVAANLERIRSAASAPIEAADVSVDKFVADRIRGDLNEPYLNRLEVYAVVELAEQFGGFLKRHAVALQHLPAEALETDARSLGFRVVAEGSDSVRRAVTSIISHVLPGQESFLFGNFGLWLRRNAQVAAYSEVVELFQDIAERNLPFKKGDMCFVPVRRRYLHDLGSAGLEYGLTPKRVKKLLIDNGILTESATSPSRTYLPVNDKVHQILSAASTTLSSGEARKVLGFSESIMSFVMKNGLLPRVESNNKGRPFSRIRPEDLDDFQRRIFFRAVEVDEIPEGFAPLAKVAQSYGQRIDQLFSLVLDGSITQIRTTKDHGFRPLNLYLSWHELKYLLRTFRDAAEYDNDSELLSYNKTERKLGTRRETTSILVKLGHLRGVTGHKAAFMTRQMFVTKASLDRFCASYIALSQVAKNHRTHPTVSFTQLATLGINPAIVAKDPDKLSGRSTKFYLRTDVEGLKLRVVD